ncbi:hypothetical protein GJ496_010188 [Pomphorhynchus laevis]|nr:hypothetical protein GJ496_010188 [Pomphorhynchus laevis]
MTPVLKESSFSETGYITPVEFVKAGDFLVYHCPTWKWSAATSSKLSESYLPKDKQYLTLSNAPCMQRAADLKYEALRLARDIDKYDSNVSLDNDDRTSLNLDQYDIVDDLKIEPWSIIRDNHEPINPSENDYFKDSLVIDFENIEELDEKMTKFSSTSKETPQQSSMFDLDAYENSLKDKNLPSSTASATATTTIPYTVVASHSFSSADGTPEITSDSLNLISGEPILDMEEFERSGRILQVDDSIAEFNEEFKVNDRIITPSRTYDLNVTYDNFYRTPRFWFLGYDQRQKRPLTIDEMYEDVSADHANKTVTIERHPYLSPLLMASVHPCRHASLMKKLIQTASLNRSRDIFSGLNFAQEIMQNSQQTPLNHFFPQDSTKLLIDISYLLNRLRQNVRDSANFLDIINALVSWSIGDLSQENTITLCRKYLMDDEVVNWLQSLIENKPVALHKICQEANALTGRELIHNYYTQPSLKSSYRAYHDDYVHPICSGRTALCKEVLNDTYVSYAICRDQITSKCSSHVNRSQPKNEFFHVEDEVLRLDSKINRARSLIAFFEDMESKLNPLSPTDRAIQGMEMTQPDSYFMENYKSVLLAIYKDSLPVIQYKLRTQPLETIPILIPRVNEMKKEWRKLKKTKLSEYKKVHERVNNLEIKDIVPSENGVSMKLLSFKSMLADIDKFKLPYEVYCELPRNGQTFVWNAGMTGLSLSLDVVNENDSCKSTIYSAFQLIYAHLLRLHIHKKRFFLKVPVIVKTLLQDLLCLNDKPEEQQDNAVDNISGPNVIPPNSQSIRKKFFVGDESWYFFIRMFMQLHRTLCAFFDLTTKQIQRLKLENRRCEEKQLCIEGGYFLNR